MVKVRVEEVLRYKDGRKGREKGESGEEEEKRKRKRECKEKRKRAEGLRSFFQLKAKMFKLRPG